MGEPKENRSFLRRVVQFVANPMLDWADTPEAPTKTKAQERSELRAMVERKRRNDFVRKREFDMLRRVRREGLSAEQLAALGPSSRFDDGESRHPESAAARTQGVVKAKIDHIEREMVGDSNYRVSKNASFFDAPTEPGVLARRGPGSMVSPLNTEPRISTALEPGLRLHPSSPLPDVDLEALPLLDEPASGGPAHLHSGLGPQSPGTLGAPSYAISGFGIGGEAAFPVGMPGVQVDVETTEVVHDPELDEAVIAFANADFAQCERALQALIGPSGLRAQHADTWMVVFDLYRATGQQLPFENLALEYAQRFGWSAPQWFSLPRQVADAAEQAAHSRPAASSAAGEVGWIAPPHLDTDAVSRLRSHTLQLPQPWVLDWSQMRTAEVEAATQLSTLFRVWAGQALEMRWIGGERLLNALAEAAPTGVRDADPGFWLARLDTLRLINRADAFDEAAIDYCVTYEVSPPSWETARCTVRLTDASQPTQTPQLSLAPEVSTSFEDSGLADTHQVVQVAHVDLTGQLVGDLSETVSQIDRSLGASPVVAVNCANLIRVDFIAAGDLLNWVLARQGEGRQIQFHDTHRLVALFFGAMGINEHARVQIRRV